MMPYGELMFKNTFSRKTLLPLVAGVVIGATVGGIGMVVATPNTITACADKRTGAMRYVANGKCNTRTETKVEWNQTGPAGATGATGASGSGIDGGLRFTFSTTVTDADPGTGVIRYNSATVTAVTSLFVDLTDVNGTPILNILDSFNPSNGGGTIWLTGKTSNQVNAFTVSGALTDGSGYRKIPVTHVSGSLPTNGEQLVMTFGRRGAQGPQGDRGAQGPEGEEGERGATGATFADATAVALTGAATLTATQMISSRLFTYDGANADLTTATAAEILAVLSGEEVGDTFEFVIVNIEASGTDTATLVAGSGVTLRGNGGVVAATAATFMGRIDSASAITIYRVS